jgi:hypothetical protein
VPDRIADDSTVADRSGSGLGSATGRGQTEQAALLDVASVVGGECLAYVYLELGYLYGHIAARELPVVADAEEWMKKSFPLTQATEDQCR